MGYLNLYTFQRFGSCHDLYLAFERESILFSVGWDSGNAPRLAIKTLGLDFCGWGEITIRAYRDDVSPFRFLIGTRLLIK